VTVWQKPNPLPYDAEVEYLESTGTQYVDTGLGYFPDFEADIQMRENVGNNAFGVGTDGRVGRASQSQPFWRLIVDNGNRGLSPALITNRNTVAYKNGVFSANGTTVSTYANSFATGTMAIFTSGVNIPTAYPLMVYSFKAWDSNGVLVRSFVPVRVGTVGYLYDRANPTGGPSGNGLYGSATSKPLVAGPDKNGG
jgi:hypothetical protein